MLNHKPIFVNGFSRGGTTILMNLLASHPDVCTLSETHHVFKGQSYVDSPWRILAKCVRYDAPVIAAMRQNFFSPRLVQPRKKVPGPIQHFIDRVLYREKLLSRGACGNQYKSRNVEYTAEEVAASRLAAKNIDGMIYATDTFAEMYPDATFIGLVRNGLALCEGHLRRGRTAEETAQRYCRLIAKMQRDAERLPRYTMIRFEDVLADAESALQKIYAHADLDVVALEGIRMQVRGVMDGQGNHRLTGNAEWELVWLDVDAIGSYLEPNVNGHQIRRLSNADRETFLRVAGDTMEELGYSTQLDEEIPMTVPFPGTTQDQPIRRAA